MLKTILVAVFILLAGFLGMQLIAPQGDEPLSSPISQSVSKRTYPPEKSILHSRVSIRLQDFGFLLNEANTPLLLINDKDINLRLSITPINVELASDNQIYFNYVADVYNSGKKQDNSRPARMKVFSNVTLNLSEDWCIKALTETKFKWAGRGLGNPKADKQARKLLASHSDMLGQAIASTIGCSQLQDHVQMMWKQRVYQAKIGSNGKPVNVSINPTSIGYSEFMLENSLATILFQTDIIASTRHYDGKMTGLPVARKVSKQDSKLNFSIPIVAQQYIDIQKSLQKKLVNASLTSRTKYGTFSFTIHELKLYPFGQSLALALFVEAENTEELFSKKGWVYLTLNPVVENNGNVLGLSLKGFSDGIEPGLSLGLKNTVSQELKHLVIKNLKHDLSQLRLTLEPVLVKDNKGMKLKLAQAQMQLGNISLADQQLKADGVFFAGVVVETKEAIEESIPQLIEIKPLKAASGTGDGMSSTTSKSPKMVVPLEVIVPVTESTKVLPIGISNSKTKTPASLPAK